MSAETDESQLVSLWIALESLCRRGKGTSIIESVCSSVSPSVCVGNPRKAVENLTSYLQPVWAAMVSAESIKKLTYSNMSEIDARDVLLSLVDVKDGPRIKELYRISSDQVLLCYRIYRLRDRLILERKKVISNLENHRYNVDWQLRRIYRARNRVMHHGRGTQSLPSLIQHLRTYLTHALQNVIDDLEQNPNWSIPDALDSPASSL